MSLKKNKIDPVKEGFGPYDKNLLEEDRQKVKMLFVILLKQLML